MLGKIDYTGFHKFLASVGLTFMGASVVAPWVFLRTNTPFLVSESELEGYTDVARDALLQRQDIAASALPAILIVSMLLFTIGCILLIVGLARWKKHQSRSDESEELDLREKRAKLSIIPQEEVDSRKKQEAEEEIPDPSESGPEITSEKPTVPSAKVRREAFMQKTRAAEERGVKLLRDAFDREFDILENVRVEDRRFILDAVLTPLKNKKLGQLAVDFKVVNSPMMLDTTSISRMINVAISSTGLRLGNTPTIEDSPSTPAKVTGVSIFIVDDSLRRVPNLSAAVKRARDSARNLNSVLRRPVGTLIYALEDFEDITVNEFQGDIIWAWKTGGTKASLASQIYLTDPR